jgi:hypothetical protein
MGVEYIPSLATIEHRHTLRVGICCSTAEVEKIMPVLQKRFADRTMMHALHVPGMDCEVLEVFDPAVKGLSIYPARGLRLDGFGKLVPVLSRRSGDGAMGQGGDCPRSDHPVQSHSRCDDRTGSPGAAV